VSRKIPTPRPRPTEVREKAILVLLSRLETSLTAIPVRFDPCVSLQA
jgi:hypothetical protein